MQDLYTTACQTLPMETACEHVKAAKDDTGIWQLHALFACRQADRTTVTYSRDDSFCKQLAVQLIHRCRFGEHEPLCPLPQGAATLETQLGKGILQGISACKPNKCCVSAVSWRWQLPTGATNTATCLDAYSGTHAALPSPHNCLLY